MPRAARRALPVLVTLALMSTASAQEEKLGRVSFPVSCKPAVRADFNRAVALLHSFWFDAAIRAFSGVAHADPECAMAYWGIARALVHAPPEAPILAHGWAALERAKAAHAATERERDYITAISTPSPWPRAWRRSGRLRPDAAGGQGRSSRWGTLVKLYPLLLLAAVIPRRPMRTLGACAGVLIAGYVLYLGDGASALGSLGRYLRVEDTNGPLRTALAALLGPLGAPGRELARGLPLVALGGILLAVSVSTQGRDAPVSQRALWVIGAYLLAIPNLFPWYAVWIVPVLAVATVWPWLYLTCAVALVYLVLAEPILRIPAWVTATEFVPVALGLLVAAGTGWRHTRPASALASGTSMARAVFTSS